MRSWKAKTDSGFLGLLIL